MLADPEVLARLAAPDPVSPGELEPPRDAPREGKRFMMATQVRLLYLCVKEKEGDGKHG